LDTQVVVVVELEEKGLPAILALGVPEALAEPVILQDQLLITLVAVAAEVIVLAVLVQYRAVPAAVAEVAAALLEDYLGLLTQVVVAAAEDIIIMPPEQAGQE
jgi:hypothetical protein